MSGFWSDRQNVKIRSELWQRVQFEMEGTGG